MTTSKAGTGLAGAARYAAILAGAAACSVWPLRAQTPAPLDATWRWVAYGKEQGLPSDRVTALAHTTRGILWAGTSEGAAWFDGYAWRAVGAEQGLTAGPVRWLQADLRGGVLIVQDSGLFQGDTLGMRALPLRADGKALQVVRAVAWRGDSLLVLSVSNTLYACAKSACREAAGQRGLPAGRVSGLWSTEAGTTWANTALGLFSLARGSDWTRRIASGGSPFDVRVISEGANGAGVVSLSRAWPQGELWSWGPNAPFDEDRGQPRVAATAGDVGPEGAAAIAYSSLDVSVREHGTWKALRVPTSLGAVLALEYAANGDLWVGGAGGLCLHRAASRLWTYWSPGGFDPRGRVNAVLRTRSGDVWLGTQDGIEILSWRGTASWLRSAAGRRLAAITGLAEDDSGGVWVSSGSAGAGALRFDGKGWRAYGARDGLTAEGIHRIVRDRHGRLWFLALVDGPTGAARRAGVPEAFGAFELDRGRFRGWGLRQGLPSLRVYGFAEAPDGALWFATAGGLHRYRDGVWRHWTTANGLLADRVFALAIDARGRAWFGHQFGGGVGWLDAEGQPHYLTTAEGLPSEEVWDLSAAPDGALWVSTAGGLAICRDGHCTAFRMGDGLTSLSLWPVVATADRVFVGTIGAGLDVLDLDEARSHHVRIRIPALSTLDTDNEVLAWSAAAYQGWPPPERIETRYRVDGGTWSPWSADREALLGGLRHGRHRVAVEALDWLGRPSGYVEAAFIVPRLWYQRPVVWLPLAALLLTGAGLLVLTGRRQRRDAEARSAAAADALFRAIADAAPVMLWMNGPDGKVTYVSRLWCEFTGRTPEEALGEGWLDLLHPDERDAVREAFRAAVEARAPYRAEYRLRRHDGAFRWVLDTGEPVFAADGRFEGYAGGCIDIHEAKQLEVRRLAASQERFRAVFEDSGVVMLMVDPGSRRVIDANPAAVAFYGYPREVLLSKRIDDLSTDEAGSIEMEMEADLRRGLHRSLYRHRLASGEVRDIELHSSVIETEGRVLLFSIIHDVTERQKLEATLRESQKLESVGRLAGGVAHELNNQLAVVLTNASLLAPDVANLAADDREYLGEIAEAATQSAAMIKKLLAFSRQQRFERRALALGPHLREVVAGLARTLPAGVAIRYEDLTPSGGTVEADAAAIGQVLANLVANAVEAMPEGGTLDIRCATAEQRPGGGPLPLEVPPGRFAVVTVTDSGVGMDGTALRRLFEPFFTTKPAHLGSGLGMATVYGIVKQHEGHVVVESAPGAGTTVRLFFPLADAAEPAAAGSPAPVRCAAGAAVLVVEDNEALRRGAQRLLEREGYRVIEAADGEEALRLVRARGDQIALVIADLVMPKLGGRGLYDALRAEGRQVPFVFASGYSSEMGLGDRLAEGVPFLEKPWNPAELLRLVRESIGLAGTPG